MAVFWSHDQDHGGVENSAHLRAGVWVPIPWGRDLVLGLKSWLLTFESRGLSHLRLCPEASGLVLSPETWSWKESSQSRRQGHGWVTFFLTHTILYDIWGFDTIYTISGKWIFGQKWTWNSHERCRKYANSCYCISDHIKFSNLGFHWLINS